MTGTTETSTARGEQSEREWRRIAFGEPAPAVRNLPREWVRCGMCGGTGYAADAELRHDGLPDTICGGCGGSGEVVLDAR